MHVITAREAARILGITKNALYRRVHNGEIPTIEAGDELQPERGHREFAFDRDALRALELRPVGRPPTYDADENVRTYVRAMKREVKQWTRAASKLDLSVGEWLRAKANARGGRRHVPGLSRGDYTWVTIRSNRSERARWDAAAAKQGFSTSAWLRALANYAATE